MSAPSTTALAAAAALAAALSWSLGSLLFGRLLRPGADGAPRPTAAAANLFKNLLALVVFGAAFAVVRPATPPGASLFLLLVSGAVGFAIGDTLYLAALPRIGVQAAAVLALLNVPVAAILAAVFLDERLAPATVASMAVVLAGVVLVLSEPSRPRAGGDPADPRAERRTGLICALIAPVCWASSVVSGHGGMDEVDVTSGAVWRLVGGIGGALLVAPVAGLARRRPRGMGWAARVRLELAELIAPLSRPGTWPRLAAASFFAAVVCLGFFHFALRELPGGVSPVLFSTTPLFTLPLGLLFGERHGTRVVLGTLIGFAGVFGVVRSLS